MSGTRVTCLDLETGDTDSAEISDDYVVITDGNRYVAGIQVYKNGTAVVTIKRRIPEAAAVPSARASTLRVQTEPEAPTT